MAIHHLHLISERHHTPNFVTALHAVCAGDAFHTPDSQPLFTPPPALHTSASSPERAPSSFTTTTPGQHPRRPYPRTPGSAALDALEWELADEARRSGDFRSRLLREVSGEHLWSV